MYETTYHRADSTSNAVEQISSADDGKYLAGGQTLLPTMKQRLAAPTDLIDVTHISDLEGISVSGSDVTIGAATTHAEVAADDALRKVCPSICDLASHIGDPHVRHRGTIGGSIANNDPAADYPAAMVALGATIHTNTRALAAEDFFTGMFETALEEDELVTSISFTAPTKGAYAKFPNPASRYAMAGVYVAHQGEDVRVAVTGAYSSGVRRAPDMEAALSSAFSPESLDSCVVDEDDMLADIHASAAYRANLVKVMAKRATQAAG